MRINQYLKRKWIRLYSKIVREKATPEYIARGWAIGMFFGCISPFGAQLIFSIPAAFLLKGSKIGATLGTLLTNNFTIFVIYPAQCYVGNHLLGGDLRYETIKHAMSNVLREQKWSALMEIGTELVASFFLGGLILTAITTPLTYWLVRKLVLRYRAGKQRRAEKNRTNVPPLS